MIFVLVVFHLEVVFRPYKTPTRKWCFRDKLNDCLSDRLEHAEVVLVPLLLSLLLLRSAKVGSSSHRSNRRTFDTHELVQFLRSFYSTPPKNFNSRKWKSRFYQTSAACLLPLEIHPRIGPPQTGLVRRKKSKTKQITQ